MYQVPICCKIQGVTAKEKKKVVSYIFLIIVVSVVLSVWGSRIDTSGIVSFVQRMGIWAPIVYVVLLAIPSIIAPLSGSPIFIARKWGRAWVEKLVGKDDMAKVDSFTKDYGLSSLIFLRIFQGYIHDFVSYTYGLTNIKFVLYIVVSILAPIPWLLLWYFYIFPRINSVTDFSLWFLITLIPFFIISWFYWKYKSRKK